MTPHPNTETITFQPLAEGVTAHLRGGIKYEPTYWGGVANIS